MIITMKDLEQYRFLKKEVEQITKRLERLYNRPCNIVSDSVRASSGYVPYREHITVITGLGGKHKITEARLQRRLEDRKQRIADSILAIEEFIDTVTQSDIRQIIDCRYIQGLSWRATAQRVYGYPGDSAARLAILRFFEKK